MARYALLIILIFSTQTFAQTIDSLSARQWIREMKEDPKGPFKGIRWFCNDGRITGPKEGCRGDGIQHGELNDRAVELQSAGYPIANIYASLSPTELEVIARSPRVLGAMLIERYLMIVDDGWIFRKARFYRGALQVEDESIGATRLLERLYTDPEFASQHFLLLREATRLLYTEKDFILLNEARSLATQISNRDRGFTSLRNKLHVLPEPSDVNRIREYFSARRTGGDASELISKLEQVFSPVDIYWEANALVPEIRSLDYRKEFSAALVPVRSASRALDRFWALSDLIYYTRKHIHEESPYLREKLIALSLHIERALLQLWSSLDQGAWARTRRERLEILLPLLQASYGTGLLSERAYQAGAATVNKLLTATQPTLGSYFTELRYLTRVPSWAANEMMREFGPSITQLREIEPKVDGVVPERLRSTFFSAFSDQLETLLRDADRSTGMVHNVAGLQSSINVRALNQGIGRGVLTRYDESMTETDLSSQIILTEETVPELPRVAGILTLNDGNSLSHVQLLARNFGIPNAVISENVIRQLDSWVGQKVVLAVSPAGRVELVPDSKDWDFLFENTKDSIRLEHSRDLDLSEDEVLPLKKLDADDSGEIVGSKAGRLAELKKIFPDNVSSAIVLPFGVYKDILDQRLDTGVTFKEWIKEHYETLGRLPRGTAEYERIKKETLESIRKGISIMPLPNNLSNQIYETFEKTIGDPQRVGVFVRSDTNVEDLPGFTGAGLNLTVPNVIGFENIMSAIRQVWASPFQERSFAWRQDLMERPEEVYVSVLLQQTVPSEKSGVIITSDLESGQPDSFTVAVSQGIGGAVNNEQAESFVVHIPTGEIRLLSEASASRMKTLDPAGGLKEVPIHSRERILSPEEIAKLIDLVKRAEKKYDDLIDRDEKTPMDIEFGFVNQKLALFQVRPFVESTAAKKNRHLIGLDDGLRARYHEPLSLSAVVMEQ